MSKRLVSLLMVSALLPLTLAALVWALANSQNKAPTVLEAKVKPVVPVGIWADVVPFPTVDLGFDGGPEPTTGPLMLRRAAAVSYPPNGKVYILGGRHRPDGADIGSRWIWEYNPSNNTLTQKSALLDGPHNGDKYVANMAIGVLTDTNGPRIYIVGGSNINGVSSNSVRVYNPTTDTLASSDSWPSSPARIPGGYAVFNNKLYIFGGHQVAPTTHLYSDTWVFDPAMPAGQRWSQITTANLSVPRAYIAGAQLDGYIYAIGGDQVISNTATPLSVVERMDPSQANPTWQPVASLPWAKGDMGAWAYDSGTGYEISGRIVVAGGGYPVPDTAAFIYNPSSNSWNVFPDMLRPRRNYAAAQLNGYLYAWGGYDVQGNVYNGSNSNMAYNASGPPPPPGITPTNTPTPIPTTCTSTSNYTFTVTTGATIDPGTTLVPNTTCQTCVVNLPLPFPVQLYDRTFTRAVVGSTGNMQFGSDSAFWVNRPLPWDPYRYTLFPFWDDLSLNGSGHGIFTSIVGNAPNRVFNVEWRGTTSNFEVRLFENGPSIEFVYGTGSGGTATIGVQKNLSYSTQIGYNMPHPAAGTKYTWLGIVCGPPTPTVTGTPPSPTRTPTPTNTVPSSSTPTFTPTPCSSGIIVNGGFETGALSPWTVLGTNPPPAISTATAHSGTYSALLGTVSGPEPLGDGSIYQTIAVPASGGTLSYWWNGGTTDSITFDWQDAYVTDTSGNILATIQHTCSTTAGWVVQTFNLAPYAGQTVRIEFLVHQDGFGDDTYMYVDDVRLLTPCSTGTVVPPSTATGTPPSPTRTLTPTSTVPSSSTPTLTPTPCSSGVIANGGFETGSFAPWTILGTNPTPVLSTAAAHSGTYSAFLGKISGPEPLGDASIYQTIAVPASGGTLSYWWYGGCADEIVFDRQAAYVTDTNGTILTTVMLRCDNLGGWQNQTFNMAPYAGQTVRIEFLVYEDGFGDDTWMYIDDVRLLTSCSTGTVVPSATATPIATNTPTRTPTSGPPAPTDTGTPPAPPATPTSIPTSTPTNPAESTDTPTSEPATPTACTIDFSDVPLGSTFYSYIHCLACHGIVNGYSDGTFRPNNDVTRGQFSKIVANAAGFNDPAGAQMFEDVAPGSTFYVFIQRLATRGYITGYACGGPGEPCNPPDNRTYFRPYTHSTRGQLAKIVSNSAGFIDPPVGQTFGDVPPGSTFYTYTERLASRRVMQGYPCGGTGEPCVPPDNRSYFRPFNNATRGQTSKIVANTFMHDCDLPTR